MIKGNFNYWTRERYINEVLNLYKKQEEKKKNEDIQKREIHRNKIQADTYKKA